MPSWRVTLGMALGAGLIGLALGWAARPAEVGWHAAGLTGQTVDCAPAAGELATATALLDGVLAEEDRGEWWLQRDGDQAVVERVTRSPGTGGGWIRRGWRARLRAHEGAWTAAQCATGTADGPPR